MKLQLPTLSCLRIVDQGSGGTSEYIDFAPEKHADENDFMITYKLDIGDNLNIK